MDVAIRKYRKTDREALRYICRETAGDYFRKSERLTDAVPVMYSDYFTENEPDNIFVIADAQDRAVGYIECSSDYSLFMKKMHTVYIPRAVKTHPGMFPACFGYMTAMRMQGRRDGVHLHIDILPGYQHMGLGTKLIDTLRDHLSAKGIDTLAVNTIERTAPAYKFYIKYGFRENRHYYGSLYSLTIPTGREEDAG